MDGSAHLTCEVAIAGGGPVGAALALALHAAGVDTLLIEARDLAAPLMLRRPLALSHGSRLLLERLAIWDALPAPTPIARVHISQRGRFGRTVLDAKEASLPALGYVTDYSSVVAVFDRAVEDAGVRVLRGAKVTGLAHDPGSVRVEYTANGETADCLAKLVAVADGSAVAADVAVRTTDYGQVAVTATVEIDQPHRNIAYERFTPEGPLALLPFGDDYAVVWTVAPEAAEGLVHAPAEAFLARLQASFGERAGRFTRVASRAAQHLTLRVAERVACGRAVLIGNAAQALHPVAGQGFNLGLRDAWELAMEVTRRGTGVPDLPQAYASRRGLDRNGGIAFTDALVKIFSNDFGPLAFARGAGLALLDNLPPAKDFVVRRMIFGARG
jgi:2-octaprenyl-6-methoxyphenol hydroxylase